ncbi:MAG: HPr kinase/phosphatase C-terminal domain-containing protein [Deltaproteobacteria bacterium]|nr:HPr kinase/phosphatase C-terminal domain-containing protein [Deltaproteobacteria bacterium]
MDAIKQRGVLVRVHGIGVLIRGRAGSGKSLAALNLMRRGHLLVADDLVEIVPGCDGRPVGKAVEEDVRIEVRGLGVFRARSLFPDGTTTSSPIDFVVELDAYTPSKDSGRVVPQTSTEQVLGRDLLKVRAPVPSGMDPALVIELLVRLFGESGKVGP